MISVSSSRFLPIPLALFLGLLLPAAPAALPAVPPPAAAPLAAPSFLIHDVRVFDGTRLLSHRSVLIGDGRILRVGGASLKAPGAEIIEGGQRTLLPGLIDAHVHLPDNLEDAARQALSLGVTTQLDMFSGGERLQRLKKLESGDPPDLSDLRTAGVGATVPGGHPTQMGGPPIPTLTGPEQAQEFVDARIAEGSDYIKIIHDDGSVMGVKIPMLDNATLRALVTAAHRRGKLAVVHVLTEPQARDALEAGADGLAHLFVADSVTPDFGRLAEKQGAFAIPTLATLHLFCGESPGPSVLADNRLAAFVLPAWRTTLRIPLDPSLARRCAGTELAVREMIAARVPILAGTDAPVPGSTYGASLHAELALLVEAGMSPLQALAAATSVTAKHFHLDDRGRIAPRMRADLLLVEGDPSRDILATRNIAGVWKKGVRAQRSEAPPEVKPAS